MQENHPLSKVNEGEKRNTLGQDKEMLGMAVPKRRSVLKAPNPSLGTRSMHPLEIGCNLKS